jgi:hypothetical protein
MVAEGETAGSVVRCPNCSRQLRVPSGKDRGKELAASPSGPTTRLCRKCGKNVPLDAQACPHCKAPVAAPAPAAPKAAPAPAAAPKKKKPASPAELIAASIHAPTVDEEGNPVASAISYGGAHHSGLPKNVQMGILFGALGFVLIALIMGAIIWSSGSAKDLADGRAKSASALTDGKKLECQGQFQEAYELYCSAQNYKKFLLGTGIQTDADLSKAVDDRALGLKFIVPNPKEYGGGQALVWKAQSQHELDAALAEIRDKYPTYRQWVLGVAQAGLDAAAAGKGGKNKAVYEAKLGQTMDAFIAFTAQASDIQRTMYSFMVTSEGVRDLTTAYRNWDKSDRDNILLGAEVRFKELKIMVDTPGRDTIRSN